MKRECLNVHNVRTNSCLNLHGVCTNLCLNVHSPCLLCNHFEYGKGMCKFVFYAQMNVLSLKSCHSCNLELPQRQLNELN